MRLRAVPLRPARGLPNLIDRKADDEFHFQGRDRHRRRHRHRQGGRAGAAARRLPRRARRPPDGAAGAGDRRGRRRRPGRRWRSPTDVADPASVRALFARDRARRSAASTCCSTTPASARPAVAARGPRPSSSGRAVVDINLTGAFLCTQEAFRLMKEQYAARRPHHQQRLDLGARAAAQLGALHGHQARDHRPHQVDVARRPQVRHRLRPDRHRQRRDRDGGEDGERRAAGERRRSPSSR